MTEIAAADPYDISRAVRADGLLQSFNAAGVLAAADVHVAKRLGVLGGEDREEVLLAVALAVRAPRLGHVHVDLGSIHATVAVDVDEAVDLSALQWPEPRGWVEQVASSTLLRPRDAELEPVAPLQLEDRRLYLERYWRDERQIADDISALATARSPDIDEDVLQAGIDRVFAGGQAGRQAQAARTAVEQRVTVVAGGPGTGKTTTVARILALLVEQALAAGRRAPLIGLAAPTGKAAARLQQAVHGEAAALEVDGATREALLGVTSVTLHRLLGWRPGSQSRFRHHRGERLPYDIVVIDETSMVSLTLMARLVEAIRADARLVLVGDPEQLRSVEAGAVLGDIVGPAERGSGDGPLANGVVVLDRVHRFGGAIARLADAIRGGDADAAIAELRGGDGNVTWIEASVADPGAAPLAPVRAQAVSSAAAVFAAARAGDAATALERLGDFRILCAHRRGPDGVARWSDTIEAWLSAEIEGFAAAGRFYVGRPLLVTQNDYELQLSNGDAGVIVQGAAGRPLAAFERGSEIATFSPSRLGNIETVYAMTVHKAQGSQFRTAAVLLPAQESRLLTRELLYTAVTRAQEALIVVGAEETVRAAVGRPIARASGLERRLWG